MVRIYIWNYFWSVLTFVSRWCRWWTRTSYPELHGSRSSRKRNATSKISSIKNFRLMASKGAKIRSILLLRMLLPSRRYAQYCRWWLRKSIGRYRWVSLSILRIILFNKILFSGLVWISKCAINVFVMNIHPHRNVVVRTLGTEWISWKTQLPGKNLLSVQM